MVSATDLGTPTSCRAEQNATVRITVIRNENVPVFTNSGQYTFSIKENLGLNNKAGDVRAEDKDSRAPFNRVRYTIVGEDSAPAYFSISQETGEIRVKANLRADSQTKYTVSRPL